MTIRVRTELGHYAARILALHAAGREIYIRTVFFSSKPGYEDYWFTTSGKVADTEDDPVMEIET